jgi:hypothetical protein
MKIKKFEVIENFRTPLKRKGKTSEKRIKWKNCWYYMLIISDFIFSI